MQLPLFRLTNYLAFKLHPCCVDLPQSDAFSAIHAKFPLYTKVCQKLMK